MTETFLATHPSLPALHDALYHHHAGRWTEAEQLYRRILETQPQHADALSYLGLLLQQSGQSRQDGLALELLQRAIVINPRHPVYYRNLANAMRGLGRSDVAVAALRKALALDEQYPEAWCDLGDCQRALGQPAEAEASYRKALALKADFAEACINLALAQKEQGKLGEAEATIRHAVKIGPGFAAAHNNLAVLLQDQRLLAEAETACRRALQLAPGYAAAHYNLANILRDLGRIEEAEAACRHALDLEPSNPSMQFLLAFLLLLQGKYREGWQRYEARWSMDGGETQADFIEPAWRGDADLDGKAILLLSEQGYDDTLQFSRYAQLLAARGATVYMAVPPPLKSLMERCAGVAAAFSNDTDLPPFDYKCSLMSLPLACGTELDSIPATVPYLHCEPARVAAWRELLGKKSGLRVGLVWAGNSRKHAPIAHAVDRQRSVSFEQLRPLLDIAGVEFYTLQLGEESRAQLVDAPQVHDYTERLHDFHDTAALVENLDLVISVDTAVAHLVGALGKPVWILNRFNTCWRWLNGRSDSPWYPSARLFRQPVAGDWDGVIAEVKAALSVWVQGRPAAPAPHPSAVSPTPSDPAQQLAPAVREALAHHQAGRLPQAEALYRSHLHSHPDDADALHFLGMLMQQGGRSQEALTLLVQATAAAPHNPLFFCNLGTAQRRAGQLQASVDSYRRALALKEDYADAHYRLGVSLWQLGQRGQHDQYNAAQACWTRALMLKPDFADAGFDLANAFKEMGQLAEAESAYRRLLAFHPAHVHAWANLGVVLTQLARYAEAQTAYRRALDLKPDLAEVHNNLGYALNQQCRFAEAEACCRRALEINSNFAAAHNNLGIALKEQGRFTEAEASYRTALKFDARIAEVHNNLGNLFKDIGQMEQAEACFVQALQLDPAYADAHMNYAFLLLHRGDFAQGWQEYEYRWQTRDTGPAPHFAQPLWLGAQDLRGKAILLHAEQGFGDSLQFVRYARLLAERGATVYLLTPAPLTALLARCPGVSAAFDRAEQVPPFDYHCPLLSLPLACKTAIDTIPTDIPYLTADASAAARWSTRLGSRDRLGVGLVWAGSPRLYQPSARSIDLQRSMAFELLQPLLYVDGIDFFSLQLGEAAGQIKEVAQIRDYTAELHDFDDTAALIANLDLVISVDTAVVHLSGGLGKPVWMLNRYNTCWRWMAERSDSPWYPSMRIFRQQRRGEWATVVAEVKHALQVLASEASGQKE